MKSQSCPVTIGTLLGTPASCSGDGRAAILSPMNSSTILAVTNSGLARAEEQENGRWSVEALLDGQKLRCLAADPLNPDIVYTAVDSQGVLRSDDRRQSWQAWAIQVMTDARWPSALTNQAYFMPVSGKSNAAIYRSAGGAP
jgi:hypothetical protein